MRCRKCRFAEAIPAGPAPGGACSLQLNEVVWGGPSVRHLFAICSPSGCCPAIVFLCKFQGLDPAACCFALPCIFCSVAVPHRCQWHEVAPLATERGLCQYPELRILRHRSQRRDSLPRTGVFRARIDCSCHKPLQSRVFGRFAAGMRHPNPSATEVSGDWLALWFGSPSSEFLCPVFRMSAQITT